MPDGTCTAKRLASRVAHGDDDNELSDLTLWGSLSYLATHRSHTNIVTSEKGEATVFVQLVVGVHTRDLMFFEFLLRHLLRFCLKVTCERERFEIYRAVVQWSSYD